MKLRGSHNQSIERDLKIEKIPQKIQYETRKRRTTTGDIVSKFLIHQIQFYTQSKNQRGQSNFTQSNTKSQIPFDILFGRSINHMAYNNKTNSKIKNSKQKITNSNNF